METCTHAVGSAFAPRGGIGRIEKGSLLRMLELESVAEDKFRANHVYPSSYPTFGGQLLAQALRAAGETVIHERLPHSLHGYFLRPGNTARPVELEVTRDLDGRSFSSRRVTVSQEGKTIFTMSSSFQTPDSGPRHQLAQMPTVSSPAEGSDCALPMVVDFEGRMAEQAHPHGELLTRFWARCTADLEGSALLNACAFAYLSDLSTGIAPLDTPTHRGMGSIDHAVWFHREPPVGEWLLMDLEPQTVGSGRGWYTGSLFAEHGELIASFAQEALYREGNGQYFPLAT